MSLNRIPVTAKHLVLSVAFALAVVASAGLGFASRQQAGAVYMVDGGAAGGTTQGTGTLVDIKPKAVLGTAPAAQETVTQTFGTVTHENVLNSIVQAMVTAVDMIVTQPTTQTETAPVETPSQSVASQTVVATAVVSKQIPAELPHTGPSDVFSLFAGTGIVSLVGHKLYLSRKR